MPLNLKIINFKYIKHTIPKLSNSKRAFSNPSRKQLNYEKLLNKIPNEAIKKWYAKMNWFDDHNYDLSGILCQYREAQAGVKKELFDSPKSLERCDLPFKENDVVVKLTNFLNSRNPKKDDLVIKALFARKGLEPKKIVYGLDASGKFSGEVYASVSKAPKEEQMAELNNERFLNFELGSFLQAKLEDSARSDLRFLRLSVGSNSEKCVVSVDQLMDSKALPIIPDCTLSGSLQSFKKLAEALSKSITKKESALDAIYSKRSKLLRRIRNLDRVTSHLTKRKLESEYARTKILSRLASDSEGIRVLNLALLKFASIDTPEMREEERLLLGAIYDSLVSNEFSHMRAPAIADGLSNVLQTQLGAQAMRKMEAHFGGKECGKNVKRNNFSQYTVLKNPLVNVNTGEECNFGMESEDIGILKSCDPFETQSRSLYEFVNHFFEVALEVKAIDQSLSEIEEKRSEAIHSFDFEMDEGAIEKLLAQTTQKRLYEKIIEFCHQAETAAEQSKAENKNWKIKSSLEPAEKLIAQRMAFYTAN